MPALPQQVDSIGWMLVVTIDQAVIFNRFKATSMDTV